MFDGIANGLKIELRHFERGAGDDDTSSSFQGDNQQIIKQISGRDIT